MDERAAVESMSISWRRGRGRKTPEKKRSVVGNNEAVFDFVFWQLEPNEIKWQKSERYMIARSLEDFSSPPATKTHPTG